MNVSTIQYILHDEEIDPVSRVPMATVVFMLYYGLELKTFLLDLADEFVDRYELRMHEAEQSSVYLSGSIAQGLYLNTNYLPHARDVDIVSICRRYEIKERCHYDESIDQSNKHQSRHDLLVHDVIGDVDDNRRKECEREMLGSTSASEDIKYLNVKVLKDTSPGYVLIEKCRRHQAPVQTMDDRYVSSLKTTESRVDFWREMMPHLRQKFPQFTNRESSLFSFFDQHGPAATAFMSLYESTVPFETDLVFCLPYPTHWPDIAKEWLTRKRPSGWPPESLVEEIHRDGCTLIPKGETGSPMEDYEWRISVTGELKLAQSLNRVQREIIHTLKALVSEPQYPFELVDIVTSIESYQFLNMMYFKSENLDNSEWREENIAKLFFGIIDEYLNHFENKELPHYFIRSRNIFAKYKNLTPQENDAMLFTLLMLRYDPLRQVVQQQKYTNIPIELRQAVFAPLIDSVKKGSVPPQTVYIETLVRLAKAHLSEQHFKEAHTYVKDAIAFMREMKAEFVSEINVDDLYLTAAVVNHRNGETEAALENLNRVKNKEMAMKDTGAVGAGSCARSCAFYAKMALLSAEKQKTAATESHQEAKSFYHKALDKQQDVFDIMVEMAYMYYRVFGVTAFETIAFSLSDSRPEFELFNEIDEKVSDGPNSADGSGDEILTQSRDNNGVSRSKQTKQQMGYKPSGSAQTQYEIEREHSTSNQDVEIIYDRKEYVRLSQKKTESQPNMNVNELEGIQDILVDEHISEQSHNEQAAEKSKGKMSSSKASESAFNTPFEDIFPQECSEEQHTDSSTFETACDATVFGSQSDISETTFGSFETKLDIGMVDSGAGDTSTPIMDQLEYPSQQIYAGDVSENQNSQKGLTLQGHVQGNLGDYGEELVQAHVQANSADSGEELSAENKVGNGDKRTVSEEFDDTLSYKETQTSFPIDIENRESSTQFISVEGGEEPQSVLNAESESSADEEFTTADVNMLDVSYLEEHCMMKAFESINCIEKTMEVKHRLENKIKQGRLKGNKVNMKMIERAFEIFYPTGNEKKIDPNVENILENVFSSDSGYVIFSVSDKALLDDTLNAVFSFTGQPAFKLPADILLLHLKAEYYKTIEKVGKAYSTVVRMQTKIETDIETGDQHICYYLLGAHLDWFGRTTEAGEAYKNSRNNHAHPAVNDQVIKWIDQIFDVVKRFEPRNRYLDELFAV